MKKILCTIIIVAIALQCLSCGSDESVDDVPEESTSQSIESIEPTIKTEDEIVPTPKTEDNTDEEWGSVETIMTENDDGEYCKVYIHLPAFSGINEATGKVSAQLDHTLIILDAQINSRYPMDGKDIDQVLPTYFPQTIDIFDSYRSEWYQNFDFTIKTREIVTINGYKMCKYVGTNTFTYNDEPGSRQFVAYATQTKTNGAYVYWMVMDESKDQSQGALIADHAERMAYTIYEE